MCVHCYIIFRKLLEKVNVIRNIRENLNSCLHHSCDLFQIQILFDHSADIGLCHLIETVKVHGLNVFAVHPAQLCHIKYSR